MIECIFTSEYNKIIAQKKKKKKKKKNRVFLKVYSIIVGLMSMIDFQLNGIFVLVSRSIGDSMYTHILNKYCHKEDFKMEVE